VNDDFAATNPAFSILRLLIVGRGECVSTGVCWGFIERWRATILRGKGLGSKVICPEGGTARLMFYFAWQAEMGKQEEPHQPGRDNIKNQRQKLPSGLPRKDTSSTSGDSRSQRKHTDVRDMPMSRKKSSVDKRGEITPQWLREELPRSKGQIQVIRTFIVLLASLRAPLRGRRGIPDNKTTTFDFRELAELVFPGEHRAPGSTYLL